MTIDGKKKYTAALIAIAGTVVAQFAPEQGDTIMQAVQSFAPLLIGGIYIVAQWAHDEKKEQVKIEAEKTRQVATGNAVLELQGDIYPLVEEAYFEPFDMEAFDKKLEARAANTYLEVNPITVFFAAQDKGKATKCRHVDQALSYWDFLLDKSMKAFEHMYGFRFDQAGKHLADDNKDCPYYSVDNMARQKGIHYWNMLRTLRGVIEKQSKLENLSATDIPWQSKLSPHDQSLFGLGNLAYELLKHNA